MPLPEMMMIMIIKNVLSLPQAIDRLGERQETTGQGTADMESQRWRCWICLYQDDATAREHNAGYNKKNKKYYVKYVPCVHSLSFWI